MNPTSPMRLTMNAFFPGVACAAAVEVIADQQIRAEPHAFPSDEHHQKVAGQDKDQHRKQEKVHVGEESVIAVFRMHIADRIDVNEESDSGHNQDHDGRERIQEKLRLCHEVSGSDPGEIDAQQVPLVRRVLQQLEE